MRTNAVFTSFAAASSVGVGFISAHGYNHRRRRARRLTVKTTPPYSTQPPREPGYYWLRHEGNEDIVEVWNDPGHPAPEQVFFIHRCGSGETAEIASLIEAEWSGPIPSPQT